MNKHDLIKQAEITSKFFNELLISGMPSLNNNQIDFDFDMVVEWRNARSRNQLEQIKIGDIHTKQEIKDIFGGSIFSGMSRSHETNSLLLFSKDHQGNPYNDRYINNVLHYTGTGATGDQKLESANRVLYNSDTNGVNVFLFVGTDDNKYRFKGPVQLAAEPYTTTEPDNQNNDRLVWKFPLKEKYNDSSNVNLDQKNKNLIEKDIANLSASELSKTAHQISQQNKGVRHVTHTKQNRYMRSRFISDYVKQLAHGVCQLCEQPAPFITNSGVPFLHAHHIVYLSQGGTDTIENTIALCPNCHARIHELELSTDVAKLMQKVSQRVN